MLAVYCQLIQITGSNYRGIDNFGNGSIGLHLGHLARLRNSHSYAPVRVALIDRRRRLPKGKNDGNAFRVRDDSNAVLQYEFFRLQILYLFTYGVHIAAFGVSRPAADDFVSQVLKRSEEHTSELQSRGHLV